MSTQLQVDLDQTVCFRLSAVRRPVSTSIRVAARVHLEESVYIFTPSRTEPEQNPTDHGNSWVPRGTSGSEPVTNITWVLLGSVVSIPDLCFLSSVHEQRASVGFHPGARAANDPAPVRPGWWHHRAAGALHADVRAEPRGAGDPAHCRPVETRLDGVLWAAMLAE